MKIVWDDAKRNANLAKYGLDFATLNVAFFETATILPAREPRLMAIGQLDGRLVIVIIFSRLGREALSIVSMRPANAKERKLYHGYQASKKL
jgi:hypothetical protein